MSSIEDLSDVQFLYSHASKQSYYLFLTDKMECFIEISTSEHLKCENYNNFSRASESQSAANSLYLAPEWIGNSFSFWNVNEVDFFLFVRYLYNKQNSTWFLGDMEFLFECLTRYLSSERSENSTSFAS